MRYKAVRTYASRHTGDEWSVFYKKWYWLRWVDSGIASTNKKHALQLAHDLNIGAGK